MTDDERIAVLEKRIADLEANPPKNGQQASLEILEDNSTVTIKAKITREQHRKIEAIQAKYRERYGRKAHVQDVAGRLIGQALLAVELSEGMVR